VTLLVALSSKCFWDDESGRPEKGPPKTTLPLKLLLNALPKVINLIFYEGVSESLTQRGEEEQLISGFAGNAKDEFYDDTQESRNTSRPFSVQTQCPSMLCLLCNACF